MIRYSKVFSLFIFVLAVAWACSPASEGEPVEEAAGAGTLSAPTPTPAPSPTPTRSTPALPPVKGNPKDLVVQLEDLPPGFQRVTEEYDGPNRYTVVYFSPEALIAEVPSEAGLLAIVANLGIYEDALAAREQFETQEGLDQKSIASSIARTSGDATLIDVQPYAVQLQGADEVTALRVHYEIGPTALVDYRYGFVVGNAVANIFVTMQATEDGEDPPTFRDQAQVIAERQVARLNEARR